VHPLTIDGDKPKQKRQRKKEYTAQTSLETQLAACKARITMLEETNKLPVQHQGYTRYIDGTLFHMTYPVALLSDVLLTRH
jgi:hypothetical protein